MDRDNIQQIHHDSLLSTRALYDARNCFFGRMVTGGLQRVSKVSLTSWRVTPADAILDIG